MLKWILGCLGLIIVVVIAVVFLGYRGLSKIAEAGPSASVTIQATPGRVFASIGDADSLPTWRNEAAGISSGRRGPLAVGDSLTVRAASTNNRARFGMVWVVTALKRDTMIAIESRSDSTGATMFVRRDSIVALGDSTQVISTFVATMFDSLQARGNQGGATDAMIGMSSKVMVGGMRMTAETELKRLKARIEGRAVRDSA